MLELDACVYTNHTPVPGQELVKDILFPTKLPLIGWIPRALLSYQGESILGVNVTELTKYLDMHQNQAVVWVDAGNYPNPAKVPKGYENRVLVGLEDPQDKMIYVGVENLPKGQTLYDRISDCCNDKGLWIAPFPFDIHLEQLSPEQHIRGSVLYNLLKLGYDALLGDFYNTFRVLGGSGTVQYPQNIHNSYCETNLEDIREFLNKPQDVETVMHIEDPNLTTATELFWQSLWQKLEGTFPSRTKKHLEQIESRKFRLSEKELRKKQNPNLVYGALSVFRRNPYTLLLPTLYVWYKMYPIILPEDALHTYESLMKFRVDYLLHFFAGSASEAFYHTLCSNRDWSSRDTFLASVIGTTGAGISKELWDIFLRNTAFDPIDIAATMIGFLMNITYRGVKYGFKKLVEHKTPNQ